MNITIMLYRHRGDGRWFSTSDNALLPKICRTMPVFPVGENCDDPEEVRQLVRDSNPGCAVKFE